MENPYDLLPNEILCKILDNNDRIYILRCRLVCRRFLECMHIIRPTLYSHIDLFNNISKLNVYHRSKYILLIESLGVRQEIRPKMTINKKIPSEFISVNLPSFSSREQIYNLELQIKLQARRGIFNLKLIKDRHTVSEDTIVLLMTTTLHESIKKMLAILGIYWSGSIDKIVLDIYKAFYIS